MSDEPPMKPTIALQMKPNAPLQMEPTTALQMKPSAALEGQRPGHMPAQGNALGSGSEWIQALKGRPKRRRFSVRHGSPFQGFVLFHGKTQGVARGWHGLGLWSTAAALNEALVA